MNAERRMMKKKKAQVKRYRALVGIDVDKTTTRPAQRFEDGQFIDAEIVRDAPWLIEQNLVAEETEGEK